MRPGGGCGSARFLLALALIAGSMAAAAQTRAPAAAPSPAPEPAGSDLAARVEQLERRLGSSALLDLVTRIERLAKEIQQLRDHIEVQGRELEALEGRQRDLYAEIDRQSRRAAVPPAGEAVSSAAAAAPAAQPAPGAPGDDPPAAREASTVEAQAGGAPAGGDAAVAAAGEGSPPAGDRETPYDPVEEQAQYQIAFDLLSESSLERAADAFAKFQADFPDSRYRDNARFWQGECLYALQRYEPALEQFRGLVEHHPDSPRVPGAKLKIGFILDELGRAAEAREVLRVLADTAPDSSEAKLARDRLARLQ